MQPYKIEPLTTPPRGVVIASGPSLTVEHIHRLSLVEENLFIVGVNNAFEICPFLNVLHAADHTWWENYADEVPEHIDWFSTWDASSKPSFKIDSRINYLSGIPGHGFAKNTNELVLGGHGGHHAIQIAMHYGCREILLLGLDMCRLDGKAHWFGDYPVAEMNRRIRYDSYQPQMTAGASQAIKRGVRIINCSLRSAVSCFPKMTLDDALKAPVASIQ